MLEQYASSYGHSPHGNWILIVHADETTEIFRFDRQEDMWCCRQRLRIRQIIDTEAAIYRDATKNSEDMQLLSILTVIDPAR